MKEVRHTLKLENQSFLTFNQNFNQFVFKWACYNFKIHLFSFLSTKQINDGIFSNKTGGIFSNKTGENVNLAKIFWNVRVRL